MASPHSIHVLWAQTCGVGQAQSAGHVPQFSCAPQVPSSQPSHGGPHASPTGQPQSSEHEMQSSPVAHEPSPHPTQVPPSQTRPGGHGQSPGHLAQSSLAPQALLPHPLQVAGPPGSHVSPDGQPQSISQLVQSSVPNGQETALLQHPSPQSASGQSAVQLQKLSVPVQQPSKQDGGQSVGQSQCDSPASQTPSASQAPAWVSEVTHTATTSGRMKRT